MIKNPKYLKWVRTQPCCHCGNPESEPHHIINIGMGAMGAKADDIHSMPLCRKCHDWVHHSLSLFNLDDATSDSVAELQVRWLIKTQHKAQEENQL